MWASRVFSNYFLLLICFLLLEVIFHLVDGISIFNVASLRVLLGLNILALLFGYIFSFLPRLLTKILNVIIVFIFTIYGIAELGFHNFLGVYASISTNTQLGAVSSYIKDFLASFEWTFYFMLIPFILLLNYYIFIDKRVTLELPKRKLDSLVVFLKMVPIFLLVLLGFLYCATLKASFMQDKYQSTTAYDLFKKPTNASLIVRNFGFIGYGFLDIKEYFFPGESYSSIEIDPDDLDLENPDDPEEVISYHTTINNTYWLDLINRESDEELNNLNKYFVSNTVTTTNEYTGMFEGKNLIVIMVESGNEIMLNSEYYPNIQRLVENGLHFTNNYSPRNICSTGNNEMGAMISLYSINNNCTANVYQNNTYFESIFNLFNNQGYTTNSFHDYYDWYYDRSVIHKNMGSGTFYDAVDLDLDFSYNYPAYDTWASDEELMEKYLEIIDENGANNPFMSFITTVTSHMPYNMSSEYGDMYMDLFPEDYSTELKRYMSKLKVVDNAIGILFDGLEERGILDDTVIVLFGDHYPYSMDTEKINAALDYDLSVDNNADRIPLIIYNSEISAQEIDAYTSYIDILPTVANLFNLNYDSRLYMGTDALSQEHEDMVIFIDGSWKNEYAFYNASTSEIHYYTQKTYSREEILAINTEVRLKLEMSGLAIRKNYFSYLEDALNNYTTSE